MDACRYQRLHQRNVTMNCFAAHKQRHWVPGGKWQTVIASPVSAARAASSLFQTGYRELLEPPASAVISRREACG